MHIPADVPAPARATYVRNYQLLTRGTGRLFLFSADHKIEHLDADFHGPQVAKEAHDPEHLFKIAAASPCGAMASHYGLIARYAPDYPQVPYVIKLNAKTNLSLSEPLSSQLWSVSDVLALHQASNLIIPAIGMTVYIGSTHEGQMLHHAAQAITQAHQHGLLAILWMYPRGQAVSHETDPQLLAGAAGVAASLGADFAKIHVPPGSLQEQADHLAWIAQAAGRTGIITAGGPAQSPDQLIKIIRIYIDKGHTEGVAIGRSIFSHDLTKAVALAQDIRTVLDSPKEAK